MNKHVHNTLFCTKVNRINKLVIEHWWAQGAGRLFSSGGRKETRAALPLNTPLPSSPPHGPTKQKPVRAGSGGHAERREALGHHRPPATAAGRAAGAGGEGRGGTRHGGRFPSALRRRVRGAGGRCRRAPMEGCGAEEEGEEMAAEEDEEDGGPLQRLVKRQRKEKRELQGEAPRREEGAVFPA